MPMVKRIWKYGPLVEALSDDELYHVAKIIRLGEANGFFAGEPNLKLAKKRSRSSLANHALKLGEPDGVLEVTTPYPGTVKAWLGRTWKRLL